MIEKDFLELYSNMKDNEESIMFTKGMEYTQGDLEKNRLANFYRIGEDLNLDPKKVLYVYAKKHWDSILCYIKNNKEYSEETIEGRIHDLRNYLVLLNAIIVEQKNEKKSKYTISKLKKGLIRW